MTAKDGYTPPDERGEPPNDLQQYVDEELAKEQDGGQGEQPASARQRRRLRTGPRHRPVTLPVTEPVAAADEPPPVKERRPDQRTEPSAPPAPDLPPLKRRVAAPQLRDLEQLDQGSRRPPKRRLRPPPGDPDGQRRGLPGWLGVILAVGALAAVIGLFVVLTQLGFLRQPTALNLAPQPSRSPAPAASAEVAAPEVAAASTITPTADLPAGFSPLPADAPDASWPLYGNAAEPLTLNPLPKGTPYIYEGVRQDNRCQIRLPGDGPNASNGGLLWVNCSLIGEPDATPVLTSPPPPPRPTPIPQVCFDYTWTQDGQTVSVFQVCGRTREDAAQSGSNQVEAWMAATQQAIDAAREAARPAWEAGLTATAAEVMKPWCQRTGVSCTPTPAAP